MNDTPYDTPKLLTCDQLITGALFMMDHLQYDAAAATLTLVQALTMIQIEQRLEGIENAVMRQATAIELIAGKLGYNHAP